MPVSYRFEKLLIILVLSYYFICSYCFVRGSVRAFVDIDRLIFGNDIGRMSEMGEELEDG